MIPLVSIYLVLPQSLKFHETDTYQDSFKHTPVRQSSPVTEPLLMPPKALLNVIFCQTTLAPPIHFPNYLFHEMLRGSTKPRMP